MDASRLEKARQAAAHLLAQTSKPLSTTFLEAILYQSFAPRPGSACVSYSLLSLLQEHSFHHVYDFDFDRAYISYSKRPNW